MRSQYDRPCPFPRPHQTNQPIRILHKPQAGLLGNRVGAGRQELSTCTQMETVTSLRGWSGIRLSFHHSCCLKSRLGDGKLILSLCSHSCKYNPSVERNDEYLLTAATEKKPRAEAVATNQLYYLLNWLWTLNLCVVSYVTLWMFVLKCQTAYFF